MSITESVKKKATSLAASIEAKAKAAQEQKKASGNDKLGLIDQKIEILKKQGGFSGAIKQLELQKAQIENRLKNAR